MPPIDAKAAYYAALYQQAQSLGNNASLLTLPAELGRAQGSNEDSPFASMITSLIEKTKQTQLHAEQTSAKALRGETDSATLVAAIADAEATLNTILTVRDRLLTAYQEISRLPV